VGGAPWQHDHSKAINQESAEEQADCGQQFSKKECDPDSPRNQNKDSSFVHSSAATRTSDQCGKIRTKRLEGKEGLAARFKEEGSGSRTRKRALWKILAGSLLDHSTTANSHCLKAQNDQLEEKKGMRGEKCLSTEGKSWEAEVRRLGSGNAHADDEEYERSYPARRIRNCCLS